jgi:hypothetical protein
MREQNQKALILKLVMFTGEKRDAYRILVGKKETTEKTKM